jgi:hypothetical protein
VSGPVHAPPGQQLARRPAGRPTLGDGSTEHSQLLDLQRTAGNSAVAALLQRGAVRRQDETQPVGSNVAAPAAEPKGTKAKPKVRLGVTKKSGLYVLTAAYGDIKTMVPGKVEVLSEAKFKEAWDKIYGDTEYAWDKHVAPTTGTLNGFNYNGVSYINQDQGDLQTVVHEMLHGNVAADWDAVAGSRWDEGTTEVLTHEALAKLKMPAELRYPNEEPVVREAIAQGLPLADLTEAYLKGGAQAKIADWADKTCTSDWATIKGHMQSKSWAAAKAALQKK